MRSLFTAVHFMFNPRVLAGGRDNYTDNIKRPMSVQSTRTRGRTRPFENHGQPDRHVQSTRTRGRTRLFHNVTRHIGATFNPRILAGGRDRLMKIASLSGGVQSTRTRGRTRHVASATVKRGKRSIHAYSREDATRLRPFCDVVGDVSIHAYSREDATRGDFPDDSNSAFQSTRTRGRTRLPFSPFFVN